MNDWGVTPSISEALPVSNCRMTSFDVWSAKRFHQYSPSMRLKSVVWLWYPTRMLVRLQPLGDRVHLVGGLLQQVGRGVDRRRQRADDQVPVADRLVELHGGRELVARELGESVMKAAGLQAGGVEMALPLRAGLAERVLELDALIADSAERFQRAGNVLGQLQAHAPQLRADRNRLPRRLPWHESRAPAASRRRPHRQA